MKFIQSSLAQFALLAAGLAGCSSTGGDAGACNNAGFLAAQHAHVNHAEVTFCGTVVRVRQPQRTRSGVHRDVYVDVGHNDVIEIDANLDEMGNFPVASGEQAVVRGEYYYDPDGREGVHWTHHTDRGPHPPGFLTLNGTTYR
ncbi:MAG TPA: DUF3465 domain-containing protein [Candidatus Lustribacter sp.]|jgi:hypothetical protein|nr:DUF3465 domain-containing protein [Candidatus Lustribacter sp.]